MASGQWVAIVMVSKRRAGGMVTAEMTALLEALGADRPSGSGRVLREHLEGVRVLLAEWGNPPEICLAGLFHSAYGAEGTSARDRSANLSQRADVRAAIGQEAEELAYLYSALERRQLFGNAVRSAGYTVNDLFENREVPIGETTLRALFEIEAANFVEGPLARFEQFSGDFIAGWRAAWQPALAFVSAPAQDAVTARYAALAERHATRA
jgi:hypothetical protein